LNREFRRSNNNLRFLRCLLWNWRLASESFNRAWHG